MDAPRAFAGQSLTRAAPPVFAPRPAPVHPTIAPSIAYAEIEQAKRGDRPPAALFIARVTLQRLRGRGEKTLCFPQIDPG